MRHLKPSGSPANVPVSYAVSALLPRRGVPADCKRLHFHPRLQSSRR